jgi:hypothetical protein
MLKNIRTKADLVPKVERRRRETINEGINEIAKIVPGCEKNKGSILARAVQFITHRKVDAGKATYRASHLRTHPQLRQT